MLKRTIECIRRTFAAALKPGLKRSIARGIAVAVKKLAVSKTRLTDFSSVNVPVMVMGSAVSQRAQLAIAARHGDDWTAVATAFLLAHPAKITPVLGTNNLDRIAALSDAERVSLDRQDWFWLYEAALGGEVR